MSVDGGTRNMLRQAGCEPAGASDVTCLPADRVDVAEDHVVDSVGIHAGALDERLETGCAEVSGMHMSETTTPLSRGRADGVDDESLRHIDMLPDAALRAQTTRGPPWGHAGCSSHRFGSQCRSQSVR